MTGVQPGLCSWSPVLPLPALRLKSVCSPGSPQPQDGMHSGVKAGPDYCLGFHHGRPRSEESTWQPVTRAQLAVWAEKWLSRVGCLGWEVTVAGDSGTYASTRFPCYL